MPSNQAAILNKDQVKCVLKEVWWHYCAAGYTINNVTLYLNAAITCLEWLIPQLEEWICELSCEIEANPIDCDSYCDDQTLPHEAKLAMDIVFGTMAACLFISNWRSYYQVVKSDNNSPADTTHQGFSWGRFFNKTTVYGGAALKTIGSSASWAMFSKNYIGPGYALGSAGLLLLACGTTQWKFLSQGERTTVQNPSSAINNTGAETPIEISEGNEQTALLNNNASNSCCTIA